MNKIDLFNFFLVALRGRCESLGVHFIDRHVAHKILFLSVIVDRRLMDGLGDGIGFDRFFAMDVGVVEADCEMYIRNMPKLFEFHINTGLIEQPKNVPVQAKELTNNALRRIPDMIFRYDAQKLIDYTKTFQSWKNAEKHRIHFEKISFPMARDEIIEDCHR